MPAPPPVNQRATNQGTQALPNTSQPPSNQPAAQGKKPRRRKADLYAIAERKRRIKQEYANLHHPPPESDSWICEFCEYELYFGTPARALINQYEAKDRRARKIEANRKRLLEKAKLKGRKGKKQTKGAAKAATANNQTTNQQPYDSQAGDQLQDDYLDDGYDDDRVPMAPPLPNNVPPMPGTYNHGSGLVAAGGGTGDRGAG